MTKANVTDAFLELYRNGVGIHTTTVYTSWDPMKIIFVFVVDGSKISSLRITPMVLMNHKTARCRGFFGVVVSHRRLV